MHRRPRSDGTKQAVSNRPGTSQRKAKLIGSDFCRLLTDAGAAGGQLLRTVQSVLRSLVVLPTFQEAENIELVLRRIRAQAPDVDVLVVDDNSPDGTAGVAESIAEVTGQITVIRREHKSGLGTAYRDGFRYGLEHGYDVLIEMDADLSHDPVALPALVLEIELGADLVIGSRYTAGGSIPNWTRRRRLLSRVGNAYASVALGLETSDATSGYRAYRADVLTAAGYDTTRAAGYAFQIELTHAVARLGGIVREIPIEFRDREHGHSKMSLAITGEALGLVTWWGLRDRTRRRSRRAEHGERVSAVLH
jgi:dolichol-phosphate mannosyltransferase